MLLRIAMSSFLLNFVIPNSYGFLVKAALYSQEKLDSPIVLGVVFLSQTASLIGNYYLGLLVAQMPRIKKTIERKQAIFIKRSRQINILNLGMMGVGAFFFSSYVPFASFFCGVTQYKKKICFPLFGVASILCTASLMPREF